LAGKVKKTIAALAKGIGVFGLSPFLMQPRAWRQSLAANEVFPAQRYSFLDYLQTLFVPDGVITSDRSSNKKDG
jgi:hypothetical protein